MIHPAIVFGLIGGTLAFVLMITFLAGPLRPLIPSCDQAAVFFCKRAK
jgi:hypothetical protein